MRGFPVAALMIMLSSAAIAQTMAPPATPASPGAAPPAASSAPAAEGITRDDYIQRAQERAAKAAAKRFDAMDSDHDVTLTNDEIAAYRAAHSRKKPATAQ
jgi:hypothetical protein